MGAGKKIPQVLISSIFHVFRSERPPCKSSASGSPLATLGPDPLRCFVFDHFGSGRLLVQIPASGLPLAALGPDLSRSWILIDFRSGRLPGHTLNSGAPFAKAQTRSGYWFWMISVPGCSQTRFWLLGRLLRHLAQIHSDLWFSMTLGLGDSLVRFLLIPGLDIGFVSSSIWLRRSPIFRECDVFQATYAETSVEAAGQHNIFEVLVRIREWSPNSWESNDEKNGMSPHGSYHCCRCCRKFVILWLC